MPHNTLRKSQACQNLFIYLFIVFSCLVWQTLWRVPSPSSCSLDWQFHTPRPWSHTRTLTMISQGQTCSVSSLPTINTARTHRTMTAYITHGEHRETRCKVPIAQSDRVSHKQDTRSDKWVKSDSACTWIRHTCIWPTPGFWINTLGRI